MILMLELCMTRRQDLLFADLATYYRLSFKALSDIW